jgi:ABC-2 type transport system ATP-binding protein
MRPMTTRTRTYTSAITTAHTTRPVAVRVRGLTKLLGGRRAVDGLSFDVGAGAVTGLVGPNGAGKTTTIRMLLGLVRPSEGSAEVLGHPVARPGAYLPRVGALVEGPAFSPGLSGRRNLAVLARLGRIPAWRVDQSLATVGLTDRADDAVRRYSLGMRQRLGIAAALLPDPDLVILDEPTNGLDPAGILEVRALMRALAADGTSVLVSSHLLGEVQAACDDVVVVRSGRLLFAGPVEGMLAARALRLTPEDPGDLDALAALCARLLLRARVEQGDLLVEAPASRAAELNRRAMDHGITLRGLGAEAPSLEEAFLAMTDGGPR